MMEIRTFGGIRGATPDDPRVTRLLRHPKPFALLVYLAVEGHARPITRDELLGTFWPESTESRARKSLNQTVLTLRKSLDVNAIVNEGDAYRLDVCLLCTDTAALDEAFEQGHWAQVLELYRGDFLAGFPVQEANGFEDWRARIQATYRRKALNAARNRAGQLRAAGEGLQAAQVLAWAAEVEPAAADIAAFAVDAFVEAGQTRFGLAWYKSYARQMERQLGVPPPAPLQARIVQLREMECCGAQHSDGAPSDERRPEKSSVITTSEPTARRARWKVYIAVSGMLVAALYLGAGLVRRSAAEHDKLRTQATLLLRITDRTPSEGWPHFAESLAEAMAARISRPPRLYVRVSNGADAGSYEHPDFRVEGAVFQTADSARVEITLVDGASGHRLQSLRAARPASDVLALMDEIAEELAEAMRPELGSNLSARGAQNRTTDVRAWSELEKSKDLAREARRFRAVGANVRASKLLRLADSLARTAAARDSHWPDTQLHLANLHRQRSWLYVSASPSNDKAAAHHLAAAGTILADAAHLWPNEAHIHYLAGTVAYERWLIEPADNRILTRAVKALDRAIAIDPYDSRPWVMLSAVHAARLNFKASYTAARGALRRDVFMERIDELHNRLFHASFELARDEEAGRWCDEINQRGSGRVLGAYCELNLRAWTSVRDNPHEDTDKIVRALDEDSPQIAAMIPRLRMLEAAVIGRYGDLARARQVLEDAAAAADAVGDNGAYSYHAAALIRLGQHDEARRLVEERTTSRTWRPPMVRWFNEIELARH